MRFFAIISFLFSLQVHAAQFSVETNAREALQTEKVSVGLHEFTKISLEGFQSTQTVGAPSLPVKSWLLVGHPGQIQVDVKTVGSVEATLVNVQPYPAQKEICRCADDSVRKFDYSSDAYAQDTQAYTLTYLGAFRGTPIHRLDVPLASYDVGSRSVRVYSQVKVVTNVDEYSFQPGEYKNYLILTTEAYASALNSFVDWRKSQGFNVTVEKLLTPQLNTAAIQTIVKNHYSNKNVDFLIIVGDAKQIPMFMVSTSGDSETPSDLPYLTMDGAGDYVPDIFASRVIARNAADIAARLNKASEFELKSAKNVQGLTRAIGISSDEGNNPSDQEYVQSILDSYEQKLGLKYVHLNQRDSSSTPQTLNANIDTGALWLTYLGHGSGTSWPSMYQDYDVRDVENLRNVDSVKPVIVDVACMNGRVEQGYLGDKFAGVWQKSGNTPFGASAYYGGTVNISWHPPAIMARGVAFEHMAKNFRFLGEALLAGQLYLAANYASKEAVVDNMEWYHLQGDPGMSVKY